MRRRTFIAAGAGALLWPGLAAAQTPARKALVIGNDRYGGAMNALDNAVADSRAIAQALTRCGFDVTAHENADFETMTGALTSHAAAVKDAGETGIGFFYYAGHGAASPDGGNYLIPSGSAAMSDGFWKEAVRVDELLRTFSGEGAPRIVSLDCCRNRLPIAIAPAAGQASLAKPGSFSGIRGMEMVSGPRANQFISFAAWEGETAADKVGDAKRGPYSSALEAALQRGGQSVRDMFEDVRYDVMERTAQVQEPMNVPRLAPQSRNVRVQANGAAAATFQRKALRQAMVVSCTYAGSTNPVATTELDAQRVGEALRASGFAVTPALNPKKQELTDLLDGFSESLRAAGPASTGVIYFAGIGASRRGKNFFLPDMAGALPQRESELGTMAIRFEDIIAALEGSGAAAVVMMVDCGRVFNIDVPPRGFEQGFAETFGGSNVVLAYSTQPGSRNIETPEGSFYSRALAEEMQRPERRNFVDMLDAVSRSVVQRTNGRMKPWLQSSAKGPIFFRDGRGIDTDA